MPAGGGAATQLIKFENLIAPQGWRLSKNAIYTLGRAQTDEVPLMMFPLDGSAPRTLATLPGALPMPPDVSPDGRWFLFTRSDSAIYEILQVDHFR